MAFLLSKEQMIERISAKTGKPQAELEKLVEEKKGKFAGLLSEEGATFMLAKELGVEIEGELREQLKIGQLENGMTNVDVTARVMQVFAPRQFDKNGKKGTLCNILLADDTGEILLTLWHSDVKRVEEEGIGKGTVLKIANANVSEFNNRKQLSLAYNGRFSVEGTLSGFPEAIETKAKLGELKEGMQDLSVFGRIGAIFEAKKFKKEEREGELVSFMLEDETTTVRATAWNDTVKQLQGLQRGDFVKIEGAYTKAGLKGTELQLGYRARVLKQKAPEGFSAVGQKAEKVKVSELVEGNILQEIETRISIVNDGPLYFNVCPKCNARPERIEDKWLCSNCGQLKAPKKKLVLSTIVEDDSGSITAVFYDKEAEALTGLVEEKLAEKLETLMKEAILEDLNDQLHAKIVTMQGRLKPNRFEPTEKEFVASKVIEVK